jgi:hypothetical protein
VPQVPIPKQLTTRELPLCGLSPFSSSTLRRLAPFSHLMIFPLNLTSGMCALFNQFKHSYGSFVLHVLKEVLKYLPAGFINGEKQAALVPLLPPFTDYFHPLTYFLFTKAN